MDAREQLRGADASVRVIAGRWGASFAVDADRRILVWTPDLGRLTGWTPEEAKGTRCSDSLLGCTDPSAAPLCETGCPVRLALAAGARRQFDVRVRRRDGGSVRVRMRVEPTTEEGRSTARVDLAGGLGHRRGPAVVEAPGAVDELTGLPSYDVFERALDNRLAELALYGHPVGVLVVAVTQDGREVTSTPTVGSLRRAASAVRRTIRAGDLATRRGDAGFVILLRGVDHAALGRVARRVTDDLAVEIPGHWRASQAVARRGETAEGLIRRAVGTATGPASIRVTGG